MTTHTAHPTAYLTTAHPTARRRVRKPVATAPTAVTHPPPDLPPHPPPIAVGPSIGARSLSRSNQRTRPGAGDER